jgi:hypothetical protein
MSQPPLPQNPAAAAALARHGHPSDNTLTHMDLLQYPTKHPLLYDNEGTLSILVCISISLVKETAHFWNVRLRIPYSVFTRLL